MTEPTVEVDELYGLLADFDQPEQLLHAVERAFEAGYRRMDAYTPFPLHGLTEALGRRPTMLPAVTLLGGLIGGSIGYLMQYYASVIAYPLNVGGRPYHSWPAFLPITFELTVLVAAFFAVLGMLGLNGLPMPYHPLFNVPEFKMASRDRFFLCIEATDPHFRFEETKRFLEGLHARHVYEVEP